MDESSKAALIRVVVFFVVGSMEYGHSVFQVSKLWSCVYPYP